MNESLRWQLIVGCLMIVALEAPRTSIVLAEDLGGPYAAHGRSTFDGAPAVTPRVGDHGALNVTAGEELLAFDRIRAAPSGR